MHGPQRLGPVTADDFLKELGLEWTLDAAESTQAIHFGLRLEVQRCKRRICAQMCMAGYMFVYCSCGNDGEVTWY